MLPNKIIEDIARRVARDEISRGGREEDILRRQIDTLAENQRNLAEGVADIDEELASVINNPPRSFLTNGAFELDTNKDGVADYWGFGGAASSKSAGMAEAAIAGTKCQRITIGSDNTVVGGTAYVKQAVPINAGRRYTFSVFHKDDGVEQMDYYIMVRKIYESGPPTDIALHSESYTDWGHRLSATFDGDEGVVEAEIYIGISVSEAGIGANAWFDMAILNYGSVPISPIAVAPEYEVPRIPLVDELPELPNSHYPVGTIVFLTTDEKLYRNDNEQWVTLVSMNLADLEGELEGNQIALEAITEELIAAGAITETKITDGSISTPKLTAKAVTAEKIAAKAVTAEKINAGAVTSDKIYAEAVTTEKLAAEAVSTDKLAANSVTAGKISAGAIGTTHLAAESITADKIKAIDAGLSSITVSKLINQIPTTVLRIDAAGITSFAPDGQDITFDININQGSAFFKGSVEAGVLILPGAPPE